MMVRCGSAEGQRFDRCPVSKHLMHVAHTRVVSLEPATLGDNGNRGIGPGGPAYLYTGVWQRFSGLHSVHRPE